MSLFVQNSDTGIGARFLNTAECLHLGDQTCSLEDVYFGPDFAWRPDHIERWRASQNLFYAGKGEVSSDGHFELRAVSSILLTGSASYNRFLRGEVLESELDPWVNEPVGSSPVVYFSSVICETRSDVPALYEHLLRQVGSYVKNEHLEVRQAFTVASTRAGEQHLWKNGFLPIPGLKYLGKYPIMRIDPSSARTEFWRVLMNAGCNENSDHRTVEARLRLSKVQRYRQLYALNTLASA
jgi:hypothetical protein